MYTDVEAEWLPLKKVLRYLSPKLLAGASGRLGWEAVRGVHAGVCTVRAHVIGVAARVCTAGKHASDRPQGETCSQETPSPLLRPSVPTLSCAPRVGAGGMSPAQPSLLLGLPAGRRPT